MKRRARRAKSNRPRGCLPVMTMANHEMPTTTTKAMPMRIAISSAGIAQMNRRPLVSRLAGSS